MSVARILVVGSGGREHALAWRLARDPGAPEILVAPGNEGIARAFRCLAIPPNDLHGVLEAARREAVDLVVIGPEVPLAAGLVDVLEAGQVPTFGPRAAAAQLESSKSFAKDVMRGAKIPTARSESHDDPTMAVGALSRFRPPFVIKADGLAAGKGVCVTADVAEAEAFIAACLHHRRFGESGEHVLIEEFLEGEEASVMAVCDGRHFLLLPPARDYKRAGDGDLGPNTGGMGALAPTPAVDAAIEAEIERRIVEPLLAEMESRGMPFRGVLYCGLMLGTEGPRVVEFNVRFGDPEAEVVLPLIDGDLSGLLASAARGELDPSLVARAPGAAVAVALVDSVYPEPSKGGGVIDDLDALSGEDQVTVFHAATCFENGSWRTRGGRAAYVMARGEELAVARSRVYGSIDRLGGSGWRCRRDIGGRLDGVSRTNRSGLPIGERV